MGLNKYTYIFIYHSYLNYFLKLGDMKL